MTTTEEVVTQMRAAKVAGILYFAIIASSIISMLIGPTSLTVPNDITATIQNINSHPLVFRGNVLYELCMYASVIALSVALYMVLRPVSRGLALVAMLWRIGEAILGGVTVIVSLVALHSLSGKEYLSVIEPEMLTVFVGTLMETNRLAIPVIFTFLSLGSIFFCYLFYKSQYIPRWLSLFGIIAFGLTLVSTLLGILFPNDLIMLFGTPAILFELTIGLWLWFKGINVDQEMGV